MTPNLVMRAATVEDQAAISKMVRAAGINPMGLAWPNFIVVEEVSLPDATHRRLLGVGQLRPRDDAQELASLAVDPGHQGKGIGVLLVHALMRRASGPLYLVCTSNLIDYYRRFGFVEVTNLSVLPRSMARLFRVGRVVAPLVTRLEGEPRSLAAMVLPCTLPTIAQPNPSP